MFAATPSLETSHAAAVPFIGPQLPQNGVSGNRCGGGIHTVAEATRVAATELPELCMDWRGAQGIGCGLNNLGNTCYVNSVLQCLTHLPPLATLALRAHHMARCPLNHTECAACLLERRIKRSLTTSFPESPNFIVNRLDKIFARHFMRHRQEDAHEFLRCLLAACERDCIKGIRYALGISAGKDPETDVGHVFGGRLASCVACEECGGESDTFDPFHDLSLELPGCADLGSALAAFTARERLAGANAYRCERCRRMVAASKHMAIHEAPNVLVIHLKRFAGALGAKIVRHIAFKPSLALGPFLSRTSPDQDPAEGAVPRSGLGKADWHRQQAQQGGWGAVGPHHGPSYRLASVLVHQGATAQSGHYYAYCSVPGRPGGPRHEWFRMDDSYVSAVPENAVLDDSAYCLFYIRLRPRSAASSIPPAAAESQPQGGKRLAEAVAEGAPQPQRPCKAATHVRNSPEARAPLADWTAVAGAGQSNGWGDHSIESGGANGAGDGAWAWSPTLGSPARPDPTPARNEAQAVEHTAKPIAATAERLPGPAGPAPNGEVGRSSHCAATAEAPPQHGAASRQQHVGSNRPAEGWADAPAAPVNHASASGRGDPGSRLGTVATTGFDMCRAEALRLGPLGDGGCDGDVSAPAAPVRFSLKRNVNGVMGSIRSGLGSMVSSLTSGHSPRLSPPPQPSGDPPMPPGALPKAPPPGSGAMLPSRQGPPAGRDSATVCASSIPPPRPPPPPGSAEDLESGRPPQHFDIAASSMPASTSAGPQLSPALVLGQARGEAAPASIPRHLQVLAAATELHQAKQAAAACASPGAPGGARLTEAQRALYEEMRDEWRREHPNQYMSKKVKEGILQAALMR